MEFDANDIKEIISSLTDIRERLAAIEAHQKDPSPNCAVHSEQIGSLGRRVEKVEEKLAGVQTVIGKKELIVAAFGAIGVGLGFAVKALVAMARG